MSSKKQATMTEAEAMANLRKRFPFLRRESSTAICQNGGSKTVYGCLCGSTHHCATDYRQAKHVAEWRAQHAACAAKFAARKRLYAVMQYGSFVRLSTQKPQA